MPDNAPSSEEFTRLIETLQLYLDIREGLSDLVASVRALPQEADDQSLAPVFGVDLDPAFISPSQRQRLEILMAALCRNPPASN